MLAEQASLVRHLLRSARVVIPLFGIVLVLLQWWYNTRLMADAQSAQQTMLAIWRNHPPAFPLESLASTVYVPAAVSPLAAFDAGDGPWLGQSIAMQLARGARTQDQLAYDTFPAGRQISLTAALFAQYLIPCLTVLLAWSQAASASTRTFSSWLRLQIDNIECIGPMIALCCLLTALLERQSLGIEGAIRLMLILGTYLLYSIACGSLAWAVYRIWRSVPQATAALVFFWLFNFTMARPLSANLAAAVFRLPSLDEYVRRFDAEIASGYNSVEPRRDRERRFVAEILREFKAQTPSEVPLNFSALMLKREEAHQRDVGLRLRSELTAIFEKQEQLEQVVSLFLPIISIQISSGALAATDFASERFQIAEANQFWARTLDRIYLDIARSGGRDAVRVARGPDYWNQFPFFTPAIPSPSFAANACLIPVGGLLLLAASGLAIGLWRRPAPGTEVPEENAL
jgi:ABC-2 type transport system permease protein